MALEDVYCELEPWPELKSWLRCVWLFESDGGDRRPQRITPDGCPELIFHLGAPYEEVQDGVGRTQPPILFAGQLTRPLALRATGPIRLAAARFEPDASFAWLGKPLTAATDRRLDVRLLRPEQNAELLAGLGARLAPSDAAELLQAQITATLKARPTELDPDVRAEVGLIEGGEPPVPQDPAARRRLQRRFQSRVGVAPRTLRSIVRFRRVFERLREPDGPQWLAAAMHAGYFDQPQMARDFRRFLGCTATEWASEQESLAQLIASQSYKTADTVSA